MDLWTPDADPHIADLEAALSDRLIGYLYHVHQDVHVTLGLPGLPADEVRAAYRTGTLAKADGINRAARLFDELRRVPVRIREAAALARAAAADWFDRGLVQSETERVVVEANLRGRIEAARGQPTPMPVTYSPHATVLYAQERAAVHVTRLQDATRGVVASAIVDALLRGDSPQRLATDLTQRFGTLNRDARRLAITEVAFARANGFLSDVPEGQLVEWFAASGCCAACQSLHGRTFRVRKDPGDPLTEVWPGKHNVGVPAADRAPSIPFHPNCRCRWVRVLTAPAGVTGRMRAVLDSLND